MLPGVPCDLLVDLDSYRVTVLRDLRIIYLGSPPRSQTIARWFMAVILQE